MLFRSFADPGRYKHFPSILLVAVVAACIVDLPVPQLAAFLICRLDVDCRAVVPHHNC